jgi:hypothetical protein
MQNQQSVEQKEVVLNICRALKYLWDIVPQDVTDY